MKKKTIIIIIVVLLIALILGLVYYLTTRNPAGEAKLTIATVWDAPAVSGSDTLDFRNTYPRVQNGRRGFERGLRDSAGNLHIDEIQISEGNNIRDFVMRTVNMFTEKDILLMVGATNDEETMDTSMEMNYFNVPMLIPFGDGILSPDNSGTDYSMRMNPTSDLYQEYFKTAYLPRDLFTFAETYLTTTGSLPPLDVNVAVFFADSFNGHDTAVKITQAIMDNGYNVNSYVPFSTNTGLSKDILGVVDAVWSESPEKLSSADAVIFIGEDGYPFPNLDLIWHSWADKGLSPYFFMIGYIPQEALSEDLINAENILTVQPSLDMSSCPAGITNRSEAMGYAAGVISGKVLSKTAAAQPDEPKGFRLWFKTEEQRRELHNEYIASFRSNIRTAIMDLDENIPCYGPVNFKNNPDEHIKLELVHYTGIDEYSVKSPDLFLVTVLDRFLTQYGDQQ